MYFSSSKFSQPLKKNNNRRGENKITIYSFLLLGKCIILMHCLEAIGRCEKALCISLFWVNNIIMQGSFYRALKTKIVVEDKRQYMCLSCFWITDLRISTIYKNQFFYFVLLLGTQKIHLYYMNSFKLLLLSFHLFVLSGSQQVVVSTQIILFLLLL